MDSNTSRPYYVQHKASMMSTSKSVRAVFSFFSLWVIFREIEAFAPTNSRASAKLVDRLRTSTKSDDTSIENAHRISIEYCAGCRWGLRGFWTAQELLSTFRDDVHLGAVTVIPSETPGRFAVTAHPAKGESVMLWDRHEADGFPEMKELKQLVRDEINPTRFLGHSDSTKRQEKSEPTTTTEGEIIDLLEDPPVPKDMNLKPADVQGAPTPHVTITYCTGCQWLLRAAYVAQELVSTFCEEIHAITLLPSRRPAKGGAFLVAIDGITVWDRFEEGRFPETKELKQLVRDVLNPSKDLGHIDDKKSAAVSIGGMDEDEAAEARKFFGVM